MSKVTQRATRVKVSSRSKTLAKKRSGLVPCMGCGKKFRLDGEHGLIGMTKVPPASLGGASLASLRYVSVLYFQCVRCCEGLMGAVQAYPFTEFKARQMAQHAAHAHDRILPVVEELYRNALMASR